MPLPRGVEPDKALMGYGNALSGFTAEAIGAGIRRFLRGEVEGVSMKFCPHPPELAAIVRTTVFNKPDKPQGRWFGFHPPISKILEKRVTKEYARRLVDNGVHPRGCIWIPGSANDKPEIGELFAPDPDWKKPVALPGAAS